MKKILILFLCIAPIILVGQELKIKKKGKKKYFYLDKKKINQKGYDQIKNTYKGYHLVKDIKWGVVDSLGVEIINCKYDSIYYNLNDFYVVQLEEKCGIINQQEEEILEIKYQEIDHYIKDSIAIVKLDDKWGVWENGEVSFDSEKLVFRNPEEMAKFTECKEPSKKKNDFNTKCHEELMMEFLIKNLRYPEEAKVNGIDGLVVISFLISETGEILNPRIRREIGGGCGEEALRVVKRMGNWVPAKQDGICVKSEFNLPVRFNLK